MPNPLASLGKNLALGAVEQFYANLAYWGGKVPAAKPHRHGVEVLRNICYDESSEAEHHTLDVYRPSQRSKPLPIVMYVHGGGFRILSKDTHWIFGLGFARQDYVVFNVNYRLAPEHRFPAAPMDAFKAYEWIVENAHRFGGDPTQIIVAGESAGANLAAGIAIATCCERPEPWAQPLLKLPAPIAVMPCCGLHQVSDAGRFGRRRKLAKIITMQLEQIGLDYLGREEGAELGLADPVVVLEKGPQLERSLPPFMVTVGTRDPILDDSRRMAAALENLGVACETRYYPGENHAFHALVWRPQAKVWWGDSLRFMAAVTSDPASRS